MIMEENTQLPKEVVSQIERDSEAHNERLKEHAESEKDVAYAQGFAEGWHEGVIAYATKLHQANETIKVLTYDNNRLKGEGEGYKSALDDLRTKYDNILATESGHESKTENVWQSGYAAGHEVGFERGKREAQPGSVWVKASERLPIESGIYCLKWCGLYYSGDFHIGLKDFTIEEKGIKPALKVTEWLDESAAAISQDTHEKEIMMQAFDKVRQIFEGRQWVMEGRGSYPYNDDRYKEEVRYMYNEFDQVVKDTWANIKSKSVDYRKAIIAEYLQSAAGREDAFAFAKYLDEQRNEHTTEMWAEKVIWNKPTAFQEWLQYFKQKKEK